jgi:hypothetical protein
MHMLARLEEHCKSINLALRKCARARVSPKDSRLLKLLVEVPFPIWGMHLRTLNANRPSEIRPNPATRSPRAARRHVRSFLAQLAEREWEFQPRERRLAWLGTSFDDKRLQELVVKFRAYYRHERAVMGKLSIVVRKARGVVPQECRFCFLGTDATVCEDCQKRSETTDVALELIRDAEDAFEKKRARNKKYSKYVPVAKRARAPRACTGCQQVKTMDCFSRDGPRRRKQCKVCVNKRRHDRDTEAVRRQRRWRA